MIPCQRTRQLADRRQRASWHHSEFSRLYCHIANLWSLSASGYLQKARYTGAEHQLR